MNVESPDLCRGFRRSNVNVSRTGYAQPNSLWQRYNCWSVCVRIAADLRAAWAAADEKYGSDSKFRRPLEDRWVGYVAAVSCAQRLFVVGNACRAGRGVKGRRVCSPLPVSSLDAASHR